MGSRRYGLVCNDCAGCIEGAMYNVNSGSLGQVFSPDCREPPKRRQMALESMQAALAALATAASELEKFIADASKGIDWRSFRVRPLPRSRVRERSISPLVPVVGRGFRLRPARYRRPSDAT